MSILGLGLPGLIGGIALMVVGGATMIFGANEMYASVTGTNYIQQGYHALGWNDEAYRLRQTRTTINYADGNVKQYRYYDKKGNFLYDVDFGHGIINWKHYHAWLDNQTRLGKNHTGYLRMIYELFGRIF